MSDFGFKTTRWSVVQRAKFEASGGDESENGASGGTPDGTSDQTARDALSRLCEIYYEPIRRYIRAVLAGETDDGRVGDRYGGRTSDDLTHDFFAALLEKGLRGDPDRQHGKFRAWLLACVKHFLSNRRESESAQKRGGGNFPVRLDTAVSSLVSDADHPFPPDAFFDRDWAAAVIAAAVNDALAETSLPASIAHYVTAPLPTEAKRRIMAESGMSEIAFRVALARLRKIFRVRLRGQVAATLGQDSEAAAGGKSEADPPEAVNAEAVDSELAYLLDAFQRQ